MAQKTTLRKFVQPKTAATSRKSSASRKPSARPIEEILEEILPENFPEVNIDFTHIIKKANDPEDYTRWAVYWKDGPTEGEVQTVISSNVSTPSPVFGETDLESFVRFDVRRYSTEKLPRQLIEKRWLQKDRIADITEALTQSFGICDFVVKPVHTTEKTDDIVSIGWQNGVTRQRVWDAVKQFGNPHTQRIILIRTYSEKVLNERTLEIFKEADVQNIKLDDPYAEAVKELENLSLNIDGVEIED
jgi:hypothetical protein